MGISSIRFFISFAISAFIFGCSSTGKFNQTHHQKFTDVDLTQHLKENPRGVIYVFSPQMPLSVNGLDEARRISGEHGLSFLALIDPMETDHRSLRDPRFANISVLAAQDLIARSATQHFPATMFYRDGVLAEHFNPGYETPSIFTAKLERFLSSNSKSLKSAMKIQNIARMPAEDGEPKVLGFLREIPLPVIPTYFIRVDTDADKLYMSGDCVVSLTTGKCLSTGPTWEPYPIAGMKLLSIPGCQKKDGMCFYDGDSYRDQDVNAPIFVDEDLKGYYQSVGFISRSANEARVRFITYYGFMRDYIIRKDQITPIGAAKRFCENKPLLKLPMLSKDGKYISGWDDEREKTVIFSLSHKGECSEVYSMNEMVSKMDWSYDGKLVAFHISTNKSGKISEDTPADLVDQQIFVMNLKSKTITKLSSGSDLFYFPHFGRNGLLYTLKRDAAGSRYSVIELNPAVAETN